MKQNLINIFQRSWGLMLSTSTTWDKIESEEVKSGQILRAFFYPWLIICTIFVVGFNIVYHTDSIIKTGIISTLTTVISYAGAYYISKYLSQRYLFSKFPDRFNVIQAEKIIAYSFSIIFIIKIIISVIPSLFFLRILNIYTLYLVWDASRAILKLDEDERSNFVLITTSLILFSPFVLNKAMEIILP